MYNSNKLVNKILGVLIVITLIFSAGTQRFAYLIGYHPALGTPIFKHFYNPYKIIFWNILYKEKLRKQVLEVNLIIMILIIFGIFLLFLYLNKNNKNNSHGSARWATLKELIKAKLIFKSYKKFSDGVILGRFSEGKNAIIDNTKTHVSLIAPTRSGKGVGVIIPTLLNWQGSTFTLDPKGENYAITSAYRRDVLGQKVLKFSPTSERGSVSYNPLAQINIGTKKENSDMEVLINIITEPEEGKGRDHWINSSKELLVAVAFHVIYEKAKIGESAGLGDINDFLNPPDRPMDENFLLMTNFDHGDQKLFDKIYDKNQRKDVPENTHPIVARMGSSMLSKADNEKAGVLSTARIIVSLYNDPIIRSNTNKTDFYINDLMNYQTPINLYIVIQVADIAKLSPLIKILLAQIVGVLCPEMDFSKDEETHKHRLLLMLDEFPAFGKIPILEKALAYIAGYGMKAVIVAQSIQQLKKAYGVNNSVLDNCGTAVYYTPTPSDNETCKLVSDLLGEETIDIRNSSHRKGSFFNKNISINKHARKLLTPEEVKNKLGNNRNIISFSGIYPIMGYKIRYFEENYFLKKINKYKIPDTDYLYK